MERRRMLQTKQNAKSAIKTYPTTVRSSRVIIVIVVASGLAQHRLDLSSSKYRGKRTSIGKVRNTTTMILRKTAHNFHTENASFLDWTAPTIGAYINILKEKSNKTRTCADTFFSVVFFTSSGRKEIFKLGTAAGAELGRPLFFLELFWFWLVLLFLRPLLGWLFCCLACFEAARLTCCLMAALVGAAVLASPRRCRDIDYIYSQKNALDTHTRTDGTTIFLENTRNVRKYQRLERTQINT